MNSKQIIFGVALIAFCCISLSYSLKCYVCDNKENCKHAQLNECNPSLANNTRSYLQKFHTGVNPNATSHFYECFRENIQTTNGEYYYKSCVYSYLDSCTLPLSPYISSITKKHDCKQCRDNGCNPAGRIGVDVMAGFATIIVAFILRYVWH